MVRRSVTYFVGTALILGAGCERESATTRERVVTDTALARDIWQKLRAADWERRVGPRLGLWVSIGRQQLVGLESDRVRFAYRCSTALRGPGNRADTFQTPLGWHRVDERFGDGVPWGGIFRERQYAGEIWNPGRRTGEDLILSRILWLRGLEPGVNAGKGVDSHDRYIYIHGTPEEDKLGTPASHGCIRLSSDDVIALFDQAPTDTPVLITAW